MEEIIMTVKEAALKNRSYRRFYGDKKISLTTLKDLCDIGRCTPSGANKQPIKFKLVCDADENDKVYTTLKWAGYYKDWDGPIESERPTGYILLVAPSDVNAPWDEGIIAQTILLAAVERGLGGCMLANIDRGTLAKDFDIPEGMMVKLVIALGYPKEEVVIDEIREGDSIVYYRDENQVQHVPKFSLEDRIL